MLSFFFVTLIFTGNAQSPQVEIFGKVTDAETGEPLIGASILIKDTKTGTVTQIDGTYKLLWHQEEKIEIQCHYTGYEVKRQIINGLDQRKVEVNFAMSSGTKLEEVVVTGYGTIRSKAAKKSRKKRSFPKMEKASISRSKESMTFATIADADMSAARKPSPGTTSSSNISAGTLTAGEIHDFSKWELWQDIAAEDLHQWENHWNFHLKNRYTVQVRTEDGFSVIGATVFLEEDNKTIWTAKTDNTGKAELWSGVFDAQKNTSASLTAKVEYNGKTHQLKDLTAIQKGVNFLTINEKCAKNEIVDIAFVVDATGSMGDEIQYLQTELKDVIERIQAKNKTLTVNLGSVFYKDETDDYVTRKADFTANIAETIRFIQEQNAGGGGDYPEAVESALDVALNQLKWSKKAVAKLLFLVLDAPPHYTPAILKKLKELTLLAAEKGVRIIPVAGSGIDKSTEYLMRSFALSTNGTYVFLTDHSGVGNAHIEPSTDEYEVEKFNDLLVRVIEQYTKTRNCEQPIADLDDPKTDDNSNKDDSQKVVCYPNPTTGIFRVKLEKAVEELFITDSNGKVLLRFEDLKEGETEINLANFPSGIYFVRFAEKEKLKAQRILLVY